MMDMICHTASEVEGCGSYRRCARGDKVLMGKGRCGITPKAMGIALRGCSTIELLPRLACQPKLSRSKPLLRAMRFDAAVFAGPRCSGRRLVEQVGLEPTTDDNPQLRPIKGASRLR